ncbi:MAG: M20 family metallopeptidase [Gammaproteobacteria bacterium]|nr:M20 family metallopeptidase [Gammaproteobacteria bacterium]
MNIIPEIAANKDELVALRRDIHAHPELAYEEERTANLVAERLSEWGLEVHRGLATTGVVGTLSTGDGPAVGLRADMDALPLQETNVFSHRSRHDGKMHACGHDGHTAMLLGAARFLARSEEFAGTIRFIFQPAEEAAGGAKVMMDDGLFKLFPVEAVFGMHNWPGLDVGRFAMRSGAMMASLDCFDIVIEGRGAHGALPHQGVDPVHAAAQVVTALQSIVSRNIDPLHAAVVSVTRVHGGDAYNIIPDQVSLGGGIRCFDREVRELLKVRVAEVVEGVCTGLGARGAVDFVSGYPAVVNHPAAVGLAADVAAAIVGTENVDAEAPPVLGSEDFAYMLEEKPGCYILIGNGAGEGTCMIHNPGYDFNDDVVTLGATYWVKLAQAFLRDPVS